MRAIFYIVSIICIVFGIFSYSFLTSLNLDSFFLNIIILILYCTGVNLFVNLVTWLVRTFTKIKIEKDDCYYAKAFFAIAYIITMFIISGSETEYDFLGRLIVTLIVSIPPIIINMYLAYPKDDNATKSSYSSYKTYTPNYNNSDNISVDMNIFGDREYRNASGKVIARGERTLFGDEIIRDENGQEIMRADADFLFGEITYKDLKNNKTYRKELNIFGNNEIKDEYGRVIYEEEVDFFGNSKIRKK